MTLPLTPHILPHNLPPRSEFIGREKDKALVHEALRSRSYLISIDGIGGIGKTSLALEVAYECWLASQHRHRNETTSPAHGPFLEIVDVLYELAKVEAQMENGQKAQHLFLEALETYERLDMRVKVKEVEESLDKLSNSAERKDQGYRKSSEGHREIVEEYQA